MRASLVAGHTNTVCFMFPIGTDEFMTHSWKGGLQFQEQVNGEWYDVETQDSESCLNCTQAILTRTKMKKTDSSTFLSHRVWWPERSRGCT